jgi:hypothetical protein
VRIAPVVRDAEDVPRGLGFTVVVPRHIAREGFARSQNVFHAVVEARKLRHDESPVVLEMIAQPDVIFSGANRLFTGQS